jgi:hypothetical protein
MGIIVAETGYDLMSGIGNNVISDWVGRAMLAPKKNLVPDPKLRQFDPGTGESEYWWLDAPPRPTHWAPFVKDNNTMTEYGRQITIPRPMDVGVIDLIDELVPGAPPEDPGKTAPIAAPAKPTVSTWLVSSDIGYPAGWYSFSYGWGASQDDVIEFDIGNRETGPGARSAAFEIPQGGGLFVTGPTDIPENITHIVYYMAGPAATDTDALLAPLRRVAKFTITGAPRYFKLVGPLHVTQGDANTRDSGVGSGGIGGPVFGEDYSVKNGTYLGGGFWPPKWSAKRSRKYKKKHMRVRLAFQYTTPQGSSGTSQPTGWIEIKPGHTAVHYTPTDFPGGVNGWRPLVQYFVGQKGWPPGPNPITGVTQWYALSKEGSGSSFYKVGEEAILNRVSPKE